METILMFACILVAVALAGDSLLGMLVVFAAFQLACSLTWFLVTSGLKYGH